MGLVRIHRCRVYGNRTLDQFICAISLGLASAAAADPTAQQVIGRLKMQLIPGEGCWFAVTYKSPDPIEGPAAAHADGPHFAYSAIYALETPRDFSALHRLVTDELWHFYGGTPVEMLLLYPDGHGETVVIGPDVLAGQRPQFLVPRGVWQGSRPLGSAPGAYSLFGTTMTPGFEYADYEPGYRDELAAAYPAFAGLISALTRPEFGHRAGAAPVATAPPPLELQEIVGRTAAAHSERVSVAFFRLQPGAASALSYNHEGEEIFIITRGHGGVLKGGARVPVGPGSVVDLAPSVHRSIRADSQEVLEFYAVTSPAWSPQDDVHVHP
jgi:predicted cupin superfamily sugar epimerase/mannose-6-phosphate isomerase-like protein (cupin superfamily)